MNQDLICYCFNYTASDIEKDFIEKGQSTIMTRIKNEKKDGKCRCETTNPKGRWCLADVRQVVNNAQGIKELKTILS